MRLKTSRWFPSLFVCLAPVLLHGAQLSLGSASLKPAGSTTISATYSGQGDPVSAIQFDLVYDSSAMTVTATAGSGVASTAKTLYSAAVTSGQLRVALVGLDQGLLPDGVPVSLAISVSTT